MTSFRQFRSEVLNYDRRSGQTFRTRDYELIPRSDDLGSPPSPLPSTGRQELARPESGRQAPRIVSRLADGWVGAGRRHRLRCEVTGVPRPRVTWLLDGGELSGDGTHYWMDYDGRVAELTLERALPNQAGWWDRSCSRVSLS